MNIVKKINSQQLDNPLTDSLVGHIDLLIDLLKKTPTDFHLKNENVVLLICINQCILNKLRCPAAAAADICWGVNGYSKYRWSAAGVNVGVCKPTAGI